MIVTDNQKLADKARYLTTQAKDDGVRYIHNEIGYNFRMTNIQAAIGVAQLEQLEGFLENKKEISQNYNSEINNIRGLTIADVPGYSENNHWLTILQIDPSKYKTDREGLMKQFDENHIQTRPVWHLNHLQKPYINCQFYQIENALHLHNVSLCLPSSTNLTKKDQQKIISILKKNE